MRQLFIVCLILLLNVNFSNNRTIKAKNDFPARGHILTEKQAELIHKNLKTFPDQTQVSFALIDKGEVRFFGAIRKNDTLVHCRNHTKLFEIGSISKVFTATLLAGFVVNGKVNLDDKINDYLDIPFNDDIQLSFKELANHTSGLPRLPLNFRQTELFSPENPYKNYHKENLEEYLDNILSLNNKPGEKSEYSNLGAGLLGYTLARIAGTNYENLLETSVFSKYQMYSSTTNRNEITRELVKGLNPQGNKTVNWDFSVLAGAGGILSTVEDLSKFALAQFDLSHKELALTREKTFRVNENLEMGLGWHIIRSETGAEWYWHNGGTGGYTSSMALDIRKKNGIIILSNVSAFHPDSNNIDKLCFSLLKKLGE